MHCKLCLLVINLEYMSNESPILLLILKRKENGYILHFILIYSYGSYK